MRSKLTSRKFWMSVGAFLSSASATIAGLGTDNQNLIIAGVICSVLSSGIYSMCEAWADASNNKK